jgi:hypothetical protein
MIIEAAYAAPPTMNASEHTYYMTFNYSWWTHKQKQCHSLSRGGTTPTVYTGGNDPHRSRTG